MDAYAPAARGWTLIVAVLVGFLLGAVVVGIGAEATFREMDSLILGPGVGIR